MTSSEGAGRVLDESGFSILEVVIALVILLTVLVSVSSLMVTAFKVGANSRFRQAATEIATSTLDNQVQSGATALLGDVGDTALPSVTSNGQTYLAELEVNPYTPGSSGCASPTGASTEMLKVTVWVTWSNQTSGATWWIPGSSSSTGLLVEETTLLALPATDFDPTLGTIFVSVLDASGNPVQNMVVTATNGTTSLTATTTASGCTLFANIPTGGWWVTASKAGYIDSADDWSTSTNSAAILTYGSQASPVQVVADQTINIGWAYDQEATITPSYSLSSSNSWLPLNISSLPLTFYTSPTNTGLAPNTYVSTAPAEAFPYPAVSPTPSYFVVPGSCGVESVPPSGSYTNASTVGQAVNLTPGGAATPVFALTPVNLVVLHNGTGSAVSGASVSASVASTDSNCATGSLAMPTLQLGQTCVPGTACAINAAFHKGHSKHPGAILVSTNTSTSLTSSRNPSTYSSSVTFTAKVTRSSGSGTPGGSFTFSGGGISGCTNVSFSTTTSTTGTSTCTTSALAVTAGATITATYNPGTGFNGSSTTLTQVVNKAGTTTSLSSNPNPNSYGTSALLTATVSADSPATANPTGTINFTSGGTTITGCGAVALSSGQATCNLSGASGGTYNLAAAYTPSTSPADFTSSTSSTLVQTVSAASTTTTLTSSSSQNSSTVGTSVTFTATVTAASGGPATGAITFKDNGATIAACSSPVTLSSGVATCTTAALTAGSQAITAVFTAINSSNFGTSTGSVTQTVYASGTASIVTGLPYGVWVLSVVNGASTNANAAILTINASGISVNGGPYLSPGTLIVLAD